MKLNSLLAAVLCAAAFCGQCVVAGPVNVYLDFSKSGHPINTAGNTSLLHPTLIPLQTASLGAVQSKLFSASGAGAGKVAFNPVQIIKQVDDASPQLFMHCAKGTSFKKITLYFTETYETPGSGQLQERDLMVVTLGTNLIATETISGDAGSPAQEQITIEYGQIFVNFMDYNADGSVRTTTVGGWDRVKNLNISDPNVIVSGSGPT